MGSLQNRCTSCRGLLAIQKIDTVHIKSAAIHAISGSFLFSGILWLSFAAFFSGPSLSVTEQACLASSVAHGHTFRLYAYDSLQVPPGVELANAASTIPVAERDAFFSMEIGQVQFRRISQFSNGFQYRLLHDQGGWWVDTDVLCLSSDIPKSDPIFAWESFDVIGNAILKFPRRYPVMSDALKFWRENQSVPTFGYTGPYLFTRLIREHGLADVTAPVRTIYQIPPVDALATWDPTRRAKVESVIVGLSYVRKLVTA